MKKKKRETIAWFYFCCFNVIYRYCCLTVSNFETQEKKKFKKEKKKLRREKNRIELIKILRKELY